jgi:hypothetical protein
MAKRLVSRGPNRFTERELARAVRAAHRAGGVARVEVALDGRIVLFTAKPESASDNDLDNWLARTYLKIADCCRSDINVE